MKKIFVILAAIAFFASCTNDNDWANENLKGKIRSLITNYYSTADSFDKVIKKNLAYYEMSDFNKDGNLTALSMFSNKAEFLGKTVFEYNPDGQKSREIEYNMENEVITSMKYSYDANGNITQKVLYDGTGGVMMLYNMKFDSKGRVTDEITMSAAGSRLGWTKFQYDNNGNVSSMEICDTMGLRLAVVRNEYNNKNKLVEEKTYDIENKLASYVTYAYDKYGNPIEKHSFSGNGTKNNQENVQYEYDKKNNWIVQIYFVNWKAGGYVERIIDYF